MKKFFTFLTLMLMLSFTSQAAYYIVGNDPFGNWDPANGVEMVPNADGTYSYTAVINGSVWFVLADGLDADWGVFNANYRIGPTDNTADQVVEVGQWITAQKAPEGSKSYKFTGSGSEYVFTYNPFASKFKIEGYVEPIEIDTYTVAGEPESVFGTLWDPNNTDNDMTKMDDGMYQLDKLNVALGAGSELQFKVVGNRDWGNAWPQENRTITVDQSGIYNLRFTFDPVTTFCGVQASLVGTPPSPVTGDLFILGEVNGNTWGPNIGLQMDTEDQNIFTASFTANGENVGEDGIGYSYFSFTTMLGETWDDILFYRLGALEGNYLVSEDQLGIELPLSDFGMTNSYMIPAGDYEATVNLEAKTLVITKVTAIEVTETPVISYEVTDNEVIITVTGNGDVHVYVDGVEVENPYIIPRGDEDVTVVVTATAQEEGKEISETATEEITVPAKVGDEPGDDYKIEPVWVIDDLSFLPTADVRQGFGMNGKFYINNKADQKVLVVDENGLANTEFVGGANCGITRDEAGNIVVSNAAFPNPWTEATIKVINPETNEVKEYVVPEECGLLGRCDFIGFAKGNLMEDGVIYLTGGNVNAAPETNPFNTGVVILTISGGEVNVDECYEATCDGVSSTTSTVINYYIDLAGEESLLYVTRNAALQKLAADGDNFVAEAITLPGKGACNGTFPFIWDEKEFFVYPTLPNYFDGFAVAEAGAETPIVEVPAVATANANAYQADWLNAEICTDKNGKEYVTIYQYYPGGRIAVYMLYKGDRPEVGGIEELISDSNKVVAGVRYYNIMGQEMNDANGITIVVTTYTDGSRSAVKVIK